MTRSKHPKRSSSLNNIFAIVAGVFLVVGGIWGLSGNDVYGILTTNLTHAVILIILGILGIISGLQKNAGGYCTFLGILLILVGILRLIPGADELIVRILNVNISVAYLNILVGLISLAVVYYKRPGELKN